MQSKNDISSLLVSVVIPVYNAEEYLDEMLESLTNQTHKNIEIICVNDGSSDNSLEVLRSWENKDSRLKVIDKENSGAGKTRNAGLDEAKGDYICFVDSDDFVEPELIEQALCASVENDADAVVFDIDLFDEETKKFTPHKTAVDKSRIPAKKTFKASDIDHFYKYLIGFTVNKLYKRSMLESLHLRFPAVGAHEDMPFTYVALTAANKIYYLNKNLYHYRRSREGSLSDTTSNEYQFMIDALVVMKNQLEEYGLMNSNRQNYQNYVLHMLYWKETTLTLPYNLAFMQDCREKYVPQFELDKPAATYYFDGVERAFLASLKNQSGKEKLKAKLFLGENPEDETVALKAYKKMFDNKKPSKARRAAHLAKAFAKEVKYSGWSSALNKTKTRLSSQDTDE